MRKEILSVALSFGATSLFWLAAAIRMDTAVYGRMMQVQALLLIITALFSLRTHDLVFHLRTSHSWSLRRAFWISLCVELVLTASSTACSFVAWYWVSSDSSSAAAVSDCAAWPLALLLVNLTIVQGASAAYLRGGHRDLQVAKADLLTAAAWSLALAWQMLVVHPAIANVLIVGFAAAAVRPMALTAFALIVAAGDNTPEHGEAKMLDRRGVGYVLIAGQFTNLMKSNLLSVETLLLGQLVSSEAVALFRVSRSFLNLSTVLLNISYQKTFRDLAASLSRIQRAAIIRRMTITSLKLWGMSVPFVFLAAMMYMWLRPSSGYEGLLPVLGVATFASLPLVLQQSDFAALTLEGRFGRINLAYGIGFVVLLIGCAVLAKWMTLMIFLLLSGGASLVRSSMLRYSATIEGGT